MHGKREILARVCSVTGFTSLFERLRKHRSIIVLNYHRIGNPDETQYDPGVFSATAEEFEWQLRYLKRYFEIATLDEAVAMVKGEKPLRPSVLITFDDGYRDNYELAFPRLRTAGVQATFFLPTAFIGSDRLSWWDLIAYIVKNGRKPVIRLSYPRAIEFDVASRGHNEVIANVLRAYKHPDMKDHDRFITDLLEGSDSKLPSDDAEVCFMNWQQVKEMQEGGMAFGSHTHSHEVLSKLAVERQLEELQYSREILERELHQPVTTLAYPVGGRSAFSEDTQEMAKRAGYLAAFSFYGGFNRAGEIRPYDVQRFGVEQQSHPRFRLQMAMGAASGAVWV
jgi:peptidoglycan/xylan/chitin deacetylase (PgdA/CDA1 family)